MIDIIIPNNKKIEQIQNQIDDINYYTPEEHNIIATCQDAWTAVNRNYGIALSTSDIIIQLDDDITGFYKGWLTDLIKPLFSINCIVSGRFKKKNGEFQTMMNWGKDMTPRGWIDCPTELPSSCIAMKRSIIDKIISCNDLPLNKPFDENYIKAEFDDTDFMKAARFVDPFIRFIVNNDCKLIHLNLESWRDESIRDVNKKYFNDKWGENR